VVFDVSRRHVLLLRGVGEDADHWHDRQGPTLHPLVHLKDAEPERVVQRVCDVREAVASSASSWWHRATVNGLEANIKRTDCSNAIRWFDATAQRAYVQSALSE
jgi:hypothetical protein